MSTLQEKNFHYFLNCYYTTMEQYEEFFDKFKLEDVMLNTDMNNLDSLIKTTKDLRKQWDKVREIAANNPESSQEARAIAGQLFGIVGGMRRHIKIFQPVCSARFDEDDELEVVVCP